MIKILKVDIIRHKDKENSKKEKKGKRSKVTSILNKSRPKYQLVTYKCKDRKDTLYTKNENRETSTRDKGYRRE